MPKRILIVDDQRDVRRVLRAGLEALKQNLTIIDVPSGEEGMLVLSRQAIDLLVLDVRLPGISGLELQQRARQRNPNLKLILITGMTDEVVRRQVSEAGVEAFFFKPVDMIIFLETVQRCLGIQAAAQTQPEVVLTVSPQKSAGEQILPTLTQWTASLCQATRGLAVMLLDPNGVKLAQASDWPLTGIDRSSAIVALLAACKAGIRASDDLIAKPVQMFSCFATARGDLFLAPAGEVGFLLIITPSAGENLEVDRIFQTFQLALRDLPAILRNTSAPVAGADLQNEADNAPLEKEVAVSQEISEALDAVFNRAAREHFEPEAVDAFWESIAKDVVGSTDRGALSYEEALQLGLAPDEH